MFFRLWPVITELRQQEVGTLEIQGNDYVASNEVSIVK